MPRLRASLRSAAIALTLPASWPAAAPAQAPPPSVPAIPYACVPTALAIASVTRGPAPIVLESIDDPFKTLDQDMLVDKLRAAAPTIDAFIFRDFFKQMRKGDGGAFDMACPWALWGLQTPAGGEPIRIYHPLVSKDRREALVMLRIPGEGQTVRVCHLKVAGTAWTLRGCGRQQF